MVDVAILDDYQQVALTSADWSPVAGRADLAVFTDHIADETALTRRLAPIVDEAALVDALRQGGIGGAALDVFDVEPLPAGHPLRTMPNTVLTPHIGYVSRETYAVFYGEAVQNIAAWLDGSPIRILA